MSRANPLWGAPRIHGELLKLGIEVSQATVAKYMVRRVEGLRRLGVVSYAIRPRESPPSRTHLSLDKDCPHSRPIQSPRSGQVIAIPQVRGLHHRYQRLAA
jgi:hypothetical protein